MKAVYEVRHTSGLTPEQIRLTEEYYKNFENSGATLSPEAKERYRELSMELSKATLAFGQNSLRETNAFEWLITDKIDLLGLATDLYGLKFMRNSDIQLYHPEVEAYEVFDENGDFLSVLYTDFHPREGKRSGAWMTSYKWMPTPSPFSRRRVFLIRELLIRSESISERKRTAKTR